jgi:hypothetical protein
MPDTHFDHNRTGPSDRRATPECSPEGCKPVVSNSAKLTALLWMMGVSSTTIIGLLSTQSYQIPILRAEMIKADTVLEKQMLDISNKQKITEDRQDEDRKAIGSLEDSVYKNQRAIRSVSRPVNTVIRQQEVYVVPAKPTTALPPAPAARHEIWRQ